MTITGEIWVTLDIGQGIHSTGFIPVDEALSQQPRDIGVESKHPGIDKQGFLFAQ